MSAMERFGRMPDDHLLEVSRYMRDLHPDAASAVVAEMGRRGLAVPPEPRRGTRIVRAVGIAMRGGAAIPLGMTILSIPLVVAGEHLRGALSTVVWIAWTVALIGWGGALVRASKWAVRTLAIPLVWSALVVRTVLLAPTPSPVLAMAAAATACTLIVALVSYARHREDFN